MNTAPIGEFTQSADLITTFSFYVTAGIVVFAIFIIIAVVLFGFTARDSLKNTKGILGLLVFSFMLPFSVVATNNKVNFSSSASEPAIKSFSQVPLDAENTLITFDTNEPVICYIEELRSDGEIVPILPTYTLEKRTSHAIIVPNEVVSRSSLYLVIKGKRTLLEKESS